MRPSQSERLRIFLVEDEALIAMELEDILGDLGHHVVDVCATVSRALEILDRHASVIDAAIIDANLAGASAVPLADSLERRCIPFVIASGYSQEEIRRLGFRAPRVRKPYLRHEIQAALNSVAGGEP